MVIYLQWFFVDFSEKGSINNSNNKTNKLKKNISINEWSFTASPSLTDDWQVHHKQSCSRPDKSPMKIQWQWCCAECLIHYELLFCRFRCEVRATQGQHCHLTTIMIWYKGGGWSKPFWVQFALFSCVCAGFLCILWAVAVDLIKNGENLVIDWQLCFSPVSSGCHQLHPICC